MKKAYIILIIVLFIIVSYIFIQFSKVSAIEKECFVSNFSKVFNENDSIKLNEVYDFSKMFNCESWDELIIVGGKKANRTIIFLKEGVALPSIDYQNHASGSLIFYFLKDGELIAPPISLWEQGFLYFKDFNRFDYVSLKRENAVFKCVELETVGYQETLLTFELIRNSDNVSN